MHDEPRLSLLTQDTEDAALKPTFDHFKATRGKVPNLFRIMSRRPTITATLSAHLAAVTGPGTVDVKFKELLTVRVSRLNDCAYCLASHSVLAKKAGASEQELEAARDGDWDNLSEAWQAALAVADAMTLDHGHVSEALFERFRQHYSEEQVIEIIAVIAAFNYFNRVANALTIPPTK
ncbi:MAG: alkylhydroperoxidase like protein AhpD family [Gemmatimonadetes bacterium]|nr:alkylhydroperoxidase like protein AhpD family [Gemmatimonadota bacterium]